jgi:hypothetical protein
MARPPPPPVPASFYYFTALNNEDRKRWLQELLLGNRAYFRSRERLNDPNELRPEIKFEGPEKDLRMLVRRMFLEHSPKKLSPAKRLAEDDRLIFQYRNRPEFARDALHGVLDRVGLLCLSGNLTSELLWGHYADGHRGVCVEFDPHAGLFLAAQRVNYTNEPPVINRLVDGVDQILEKSMFTKGADWTYEDEWRVIARWRDEGRIARYFEQYEVPDELARFMRDQHGPRYYSFPAEAVPSVVLGSRIAADVEAWLRGVLNQRPGALPLRRAVITSDRTITVA